MDLNTNYGSQTWFSVRLVEKKNPSLWERAEALDCITYFLLTWVFFFL